MGVDRRAARARFRVAAGMLVSVALLAGVVATAADAWVGEPLTLPPPPEPAARAATLPPGSPLPSDAEAAARVRRSSWEPRPENDQANHTTPPPGLKVAIDGASPEGNQRLAGRIDGNFTGTTDEIIQWAAYKWGFDEDIVRAVAAQESWWRQSFVGDAGQSFGLMQVKASVHDGTAPWAANSTAFNLDYALAWRRACFEGYFSAWVPAEARGDEWGCIGLWYWGAWKTPEADAYVARVQGLLAAHAWQQPDFASRGAVGADAPSPSGPAGTLVASSAGLRPNSLLSRHAEVAASPDVAQPDAVVDGHYCAWPAWRTSTFPTWLAIQVGPGPARLLLNWSSDYSFDYLGDGTKTTYGIPRAYTIQTSADSTDGQDGTWTTVVEVQDNFARGRAHSFDFAGARWVKMTVTGVIPGTDGNTLAIDEIDIHDASQGTSDSVLFMGDSITAGSFGRCDEGQPSYAELVHQASPAFFPAMLNAGVGGVNSAFGTESIDRWLALNPDFHVWAIGFGTNDAWQAVDPAVFETNLQTIIDHIRAAGKEPVLARVPFARQGPSDERIRALNAVIDRLTERNHLVRGPDLYGWFQAHPDELGDDGVHPNAAGIVSINRLWFEALRGIYQP